MTTATEPLHLPDAPAIPGLAFRRFTAPDDYDTVTRVAVAASVHDGLDWVPDAATLRVEYENRADFKPARDVLIAEVNGEVVAWGETGRQVRDGLALYTTSGAVDPAWRRRGIGQSILHHNEAHLRTLATHFDDPDGRALGAWISDRETGHRHLLEAEGYVPVRYGFTMIRPSLDDIPEAPLPDGLEIRDVRPEDHRAIFDADAEAFRDHWGHREPTEEDFTGLFALPDLDTSLWSVAWDGDQVAGSVQTFVWKTENETLGVRRGWLEHISVRRPWRRRGVAKAIIADALHRLQAAGMNEAMLGVDSENPLGALQLYESIGFVTKDRGTAYRKAWEPGGRLF
jgi:mycothiol synthase